MPDAISAHREVAAYLTGSYHDDLIAIDEAREAFVQARGPIPFDRNLAAVGAIEPRFEIETIGWENEDELRAAGVAPIEEFGSTTPVGWCTNHGDPEPIPLQRVVLRWYPTVTIRPLTID